MSYQSINPATGKTLQTFTETTDEELESALQAAAACYESWRCLTFDERAAIANRASEILLSRIDEFARPMSLEMGKRFEEAQAEVWYSSTTRRGRRAACHLAASRIPVTDGSFPGWVLRSL